ncbi:17082_t:CDS:2, partial [Gigaspora rosea]
NKASVKTHMPRIYTLSDIGEGSKLGDIPSSRYPPSRTELENQLACANRDREIAIECGNRLANKCSVLDKDNKRIQRDLKQSNNDKEKLSKHTYQLINEDILDPVESKTHCSAIVKGGEEKNMQSEEQSFISNSRNTSESRPEGSLLCRPFKGDSSSHKSLAKYFKSKTLPIITNNQNSESLIQDITNKQNPESLIQDITNKQNPESLIQDITIKETVCAGEALVNDKNIFHPLPPSRSLNSEPDYSHRMTASNNLFSGIYSQSEGTNVPKPTMNEQ